MQPNEIIPTILPFPADVMRSTATPLVTFPPGNVQGALPTIIPLADVQRVLPINAPFIAVPKISFPAVTPTFLPTRTSPPVVPRPGIVNVPAVPTGVTLNVMPQVRIQATPILNMVPIPSTTEIIVKELVLRPWQTEWAHRAHNILLRNHGYIDTSRMGSGKTYVLMWLASAKQFGFRLIIICPVIMIDVWKRTAIEYDVPVLDIISYQSLRSQKGHQPKHGFLNRYDNITDGGTRQVSFVASAAYLELVNQGVMIVCDEVQNIKNASAQYKACNALIRPILSAGGHSRFALLSGTPFDKEEHAVNLLKLIGYIRAHRLYTYVRETKELVLEGMQELIDACMFINAEDTNRVLAEIPPVKSKMNLLCYTLYIRVIKTNISGAMPAPTTIVGRFDVKNGFYNMTGERAQELQDAINQLADATRFNEATGMTDMRTDNIGAVTTALVRTENAKVYDFARVANLILTASPNNKLIISVNYTSSIEGLKDTLFRFRPVILNGKLTGPKKSAVVLKFNTDPNCRLLIMNTAVGGVGISLHDTDGNYPRYMLMSPSYKLIQDTQAAGRIWRDGTLSDATVRMFYGKGEGARETGILSALARKSQVLRGTLETDVTNQLILPGDYENEEERDQV